MWDFCGFNAKTNGDGLTEDLHEQPLVLVQWSRSANVVEALPDCGNISETLGKNSVISQSNIDFSNRIFLNPSKTEWRYNQSEHPSEGTLPPPQFTLNVSLIKDVPLDLFHQKHDKCSAKTEQFSLKWLSLSRNDSPDWSFSENRTLLIPQRVDWWRGGAAVRKDLQSEERKDQLIHHMRMLK